jgi:hypothetical protein
MAFLSAQTALVTGGASSGLGGHWPAQLAVPGSRVLSSTLPTEWPQKRWSRRCEFGARWPARPTSGTKPRSPRYCNWHGSCDPRHPRGERPACGDRTIGDMTLAPWNESCPSQYFWRTRRALGGPPLGGGSASPRLAADEADDVVGATLYVDGDTPSRFRRQRRPLQDDRRSQRVPRRHPALQAKHCSSREEAGSLRPHGEEAGDLWRRCFDLDHDRFLNGV